MRNRRPIDRAQMLLVALLPTMLISGTEQPAGGPVLIAQVMTISQESDDAVQSPNAEPIVPDGPSQMDLINEADDREEFDSISKPRTFELAFEGSLCLPPGSVDLDGRPDYRLRCGTEAVREKYQSTGLDQREQQLAETQGVASGGNGTPRANSGSGLQQVQGTDKCSKGCIDPADFRRAKL